MATVPIVLILLAALVISSFASRALPAGLPAPLVQMAVGAAIGLVPILQVDLDPELFFLLLVPPLLFFDGWRIPNEELLQDRRINLQLALGLVALTVVCIGYLVHWLIPGLPLPVAFAFAAAVSPTDAISVASITHGKPIAHRMMRILTGESLLNDATGLVCMRFAVVAVITGSFSLLQALIGFAWISAGGIVIGIGTALVIARGCNWLTVRVGEEPGVQIIISVLIPFVAYILADLLRCSGVLAAVCAGLAMSHAESQGTSSAITRVQRTSVWQTIHFVANGIVFVLLGEQLPKLAASANVASAAMGGPNLGWLLPCVVVIYLGLMTIRCIWLIVVLPRDFLWPGTHRAMRHFKWRELAIMVLASPRGAITVAGAMTLPVWIDVNVPFPGRNLVILLATSVMLLSLLAASAGLPALLNGMKIPEPEDSQEENMARVYSAKAALQAVRHIERELRKGDGLTDGHSQALSKLQELYSTVIESKSRAGWAAEESRKIESVEVELRLSGINAEREAIFELLREQKINSGVADKLIRELDLLQTHHDEK